ncbi:MAG: CBS domain-containing protein, partial [Myxococcales bacterium]|nr:CBS domain-containing protein [Myxococcales bacterium]
PREGRRHRLLSLPDDRVRSVMATRVVAVGPDDALEVAARKMVKERMHRLFVLDQGRPVGVFSTFDAMQAVQDRRIQTSLGALMHTSMVVVEASAPVSLAVDRMTAAHIHAVVVVDSEWPIGIFAQADALAVRDVPPETKVEEWMDVAILCLPVGMAAHRAAAHALAMDVEQVLVMNDEGACGIVSALDFTRALFEAPKGD